MEVTLTWAANPKQSAILDFKYITGKANKAKVYEWINKNKPSLNKAQYWNILMGARSKDGDQAGDAVDPEIQVDVKDSSTVTESLSLPQSAVADSIPQDSIEDQVEEPSDDLSNLNEEDSIYVHVSADDEDIKLISTLDDYKVQVEVDLKNWKEQADLVGDDNYEEFDYSQLKMVTDDEFLSTRMKQILKEFDKTYLYQNEEPLDKKNLFKERLWFPGKTDQKKHTCLIDAVNLYFGGPLFDTAEKFMALYQSRCHMVRTRMPEHSQLYGLSLKNLHHFYYNYHSNKWYSPKLVLACSEAQLDDIRAVSPFTFGGMLD